MAARTTRRHCIFLYPALFAVVPWRGMLTA